MLEIFDLFASRQHASAEIRAAALTRMKTRHRLVTASPQTHAKESISFERKKSSHALWYSIKRHSMAA